MDMTTTMAAVPQIEWQGPRCHDRYIGRCQDKKCKIVNRVEGARAAGHKVFVWKGTRRIAVTCACGATAELRQVVGYYRPEVKCGALCRASKGPSCDCACGGEHHGRG